MRLISYVSSLRRSTPFIVLLTTSILGIAPAKACSLAVRVDTQLPDGNWAVPSNEVFKFWHHSSGMVSALLVDGNKKWVPAAITTTIVPISDHLEAPYYSVLRPFRPLMAGNYELQIRTRGGSMQTQRLSVHSGTDLTTPNAPRKFVATLESVDVEVDINADCSRVTEKRTFLVLTTEKETQRGALVYSPQESLPQHGISAFPELRSKAEIEKTQPAEALSYNLNWIPLVNGQPDEKRKQTICGLRAQPMQTGVSPQTNTFLIPLSAFQSLKSSDKQIRLSLEAEDSGGNKSQPARFTLAARDLLKRRDMKTKRLDVATEIPIDEELTKDLRRFREATVVSERGVFDLIQPTTLFGLGAAADNTFKKAIAEQEGKTIMVQGIIPAKNAQVTIEMPVTIQGGKARVLVSKSYLQELLADLPLTEPLVEKIDIRMGTVGARRKSVRAGVYLYYKGQSDLRYFMWPMEQPNEIKASVQRLITWRQIFEKNDYYRILAAKHEGVSPEMTEDVINSKNANVSVTFADEPHYIAGRWTIENGIVKLSYAEGTFTNLGVGEFEKPFQELARQLDLSAERQAVTRTYLRSAADSGFTVDFGGISKFTISTTGEVKRVPLNRIVR